MTPERRQRRERDLDRIKRMFTPDEAEFERLKLIAELEAEWRHYGAT